MTTERPEDGCPFEKELPLLLYQHSTAAGELSREERERLESHRATCARCAAAFGELEAMSQALDAAPIAMPHADRWDSLKADVLRRVAAESRDPARADLDMAQLEKSISELGHTSDVQPAAAGSCEEMEEDLLCLNEVGRTRRDEVLAHVATCPACRETRDSFGVLGIVLNRDRVVWPEIDKWDALRANVLARVEPDAAPKKKDEPAPSKAADAPVAPPQAPKAVEKPAEKKKVPSGRSAPQAPVIALRPPVAPRTWTTYALRAAVVLVAFLVGAAASPWLRGASPDDVRELRREAEGAGTLAVAIQKYELVVREGLGRVECQADVDEALTQLPALRRCERAAAAFGADKKRVELLNVVAQFPETRATEFALRLYRDMMETTPSQVRPASPNAPVLDPGQQLVQKKSGFDEDETPIKIDPTRIHLLTDALENQYASLSQIADDERRSAKERELRVALAAAHLQKAAAAPQTAKLDYERVLELYKEDATSPSAVAARRGMEKLRQR